MTQAGWIAIATTLLIVASGPVQGQEPSNPSNTEATGLTIDLPACRRDMKAWKLFSPGKLDFDPRLWNDPYFKKRIKESDARWRKEDVIDVTWVDVDGDGWCDAIVSSEKEPYGNVKGKPILLFQPREIHLRTAQGFKPFGGGKRSIDYEGSSFTVYWDTESHSAAIYSRIWQGNLIAGLGPGDDAFHFRQMMRASFAAHKAGNVDEESQYATEVEPFLYTSRYLPRAVVKRIWAEEAQRAGVDLAFPYAD
ncbi:hypothetical protein JNX00_06910 [Hydrogenophaga sp. YM1]|uniref:hypothetical protein n=1 Tax=Hydrogenophaga sp. YM1 TaxID=2806262 RepID=UPI00195BBBD9|nr:hypothetical protein [Hydrogenophaga sp. YM1]QRR35588.1 hypothetical protein JNX00_06910 [Hydrogenophaga sp. YM1]